MCDDLATLCVNLGNFGPATPEFTRVVGVQPSFKNFLRQNYLSIFFTDFHKMFTIWHMFDRRLPICSHFFRSLKGHCHDNQF